MYALQINIGGIITAKKYLWRYIMRRKNKLPWYRAENIPGPLQWQIKNIYGALQNQIWVGIGPFKKYIPTVPCRK